MSTTLKAALIQLSAGVHKDKNTAVTKRLVIRAARARAKFILLPEVFNCRGRIQKARDLKGVAEPVPGPSTKPLIALAQKHRVYILAGSVLERTKTQKAYNTSILISPKGKIEAKYRKQNLFNARMSGVTINESRFLLKGSRGIVADVLGFKVGLSICYDLRFANLYGRYKMAGADIICVPSAFTYKTGKAHWEVLLRSRAIENQCFVLAPNQSGVDARGVRAYGNSMAVDPWGRVIKRAAAEKEKILYVNLSKKRIKQAGKILPSLRV